MKQLPEKIALEAIGKSITYVMPAVDIRSINDGFSVNTFTDECASIISGQLLNRNVEFIREFDDFARSDLIGDELHLRQILINILGNSVKFTPDGGKICFRVRKTGTADGKARFRFEIENTGIGMKPEFLQHIWEPFLQKDSGNRWKSFADEQLTDLRACLVSPRARLFGKICRLLR